MEKGILKSDSVMCPLIGMRILLSTCALLRWKKTKIDVQGAFLQSCAADCDVFVKPPKECKLKSFYWLLLVAAYGFVNANAKWQLHSDDTLFQLGLSQSPYIPQLF